MECLNGSVPIRPEIARVEEYVPGESFDAFSARTGVPIERLIKLNSNESSYPPSPRVAQALGAFVNYNLYPDAEGRALIADLATYVGVDPAQIVISNGSNELLTQIWRVFLGPGESVLTSPPTWSFYTTATTLSGGVIINVPRHDDYSLDVPALLAAVREDTRIIILCSPNNPTGNLVSRDELDAVLATGRIVIVDEAYVEFAGPEVLAQSPAHLVAQHQNLIVIRTMSKWAGLAGLRLGYGIFPTWLVPHIRKLQLPFEVNLAAHIAVHETLQDLPLLRERVAALMAERDRLYDVLAAQPYLRAFPSHGNFVLAEITDARLSITTLRACMEEHGIILRYFRTPDLSRHLRITIGTAAHTDAVAAVLAAINTQLGAIATPATTPVTVDEVTTPALV